MLDSSSDLQASKSDLSSKFDLSIIASTFNLSSEDFLEDFPENLDTLSFELKGLSHLSPMKRMLQSLLYQTDQSWQLIVVGDLLIAQHFAQHFTDQLSHILQLSPVEIRERVHIEAGEATLSFLQGLNTAVTQVITPYVMFLTPGVTWSPVWVAQQRAAMQCHPHALACLSRIQLVDRQGMTIWQCSPLTSEGWQTSLTEAANDDGDQSSLSSTSVLPWVMPLPLANALVWNIAGTLGNLIVRVSAWHRSEGLAIDLPPDLAVWLLICRLTQQGIVLLRNRPQQNVVPQPLMQNEEDAFLSQSLYPDKFYVDSFQTKQPGVPEIKAAVMINSTINVANPNMATDIIYLIPDQASQLYGLTNINIEAFIESFLERLFIDVSDPERRLRAQVRCNFLRWFTFLALMQCDPKGADWVRVLMDYDRQLRANSTLVDHCLNWLQEKQVKNYEIHPLTPNSIVKTTHTPKFLINCLELTPFPLISIVLPVFNGASTICETLNSVFAQTETSYEILVINDGSTDTTIQYLTEVKDERLWVYSFERSGVSISRNRGLQLARGRYCAFLDADDLWTPNKLAAQVQALLNCSMQAVGEVAAAYSWVDYIDLEGKWVRSGSHLTVNGDAFLHLLLTNFLENGSNLLVKTEVAKRVGDFSAQLNYGEDWEYNLRLAWITHFVCVPEVHVLYRLSNVSASAQITHLEVQCLQVIERGYAIAPTALNHFKSQSLSNLYRYLTYRTLQAPWTAENCQLALGYLHKISVYSELVSPTLFAPLKRACQAYLYLSQATAQQIYPPEHLDFTVLFQGTRSRPYPLVSVIIPAYNAEQTITTTIQSVLAQTLDDFEIIVIDDGSTDATVATVEAIDDPRIQIFSYPNAGQGESRNRGASHATGEFFAFLDADDLWTPDKLERMVKAIGDTHRSEHPGQPAAVAYSWVDWVDETGQFLQRGCATTRNGYVYEQLLLSDFIAGGSNLMVWRGAFFQVGGFNPSYPPAEDRDLWLRLAEKFHFVAIEAPLLRYRQIPNSQSANVRRMEQSQRRVIQAALQRAPHHPPFKQVPDLLPYYKKQIFSNTYKYLVFKALDTQPDRRSALLATRLLSQVLVYEPSLAKQAPRLILKLWLRILMTLISPKLVQTLFIYFGTWQHLHRILLTYTKMSVWERLPKKIQHQFARLSGF